MARHWASKSSHNVHISRNFFNHIKNKSLSLQEVSTQGLAPEPGLVLFVHYDNSWLKTRGPEWFLLRNLRRVTRRRNNINLVAGSHRHRLKIYDYGKTWFVARLL